MLRALYMEHCEEPEALEQFESSYGFSTCAKEEFECVVGEEGVDTKTWTLVKDAVPKVASKTGVGVRDARTLSEVLKSAEVEKAKLGAEEVVALRLLTGPMHEVYNFTLRGGGGGAEGGKGVRFAATCLLISSGLLPPPKSPPRAPRAKCPNILVFARVTPGREVKPAAPLRARNHDYLPKNPPNAQNSRGLPGTRSGEAGAGRGGAHG